MLKTKELAIYGVVLFTCILMAFSLTGISFGAMKTEAVIKAGTAGESPSSGKPILLAEGKKRMIPLANSSADKVMPPPCTITGVKGKIVTLRDFKGRVDTVEVTEVGGIRIGDKAVVKDGLLIIGIVPE